MSRTIWGALFVALGLATGLPAHGATMPAPLAGLRGPVDYGVAPDAAPPAHAIDAKVATSSPDEWLAQFRAALRTSRQARTQRALQDAASLATALQRPGGLDGVVARRLAALDRGIAAAGAAQGTAGEVAALRGARTALLGYPIHLCIGSGPHAWVATGQIYAGGDTLATDEVEPQGIVTIAGCHFGTQAGTVTIRLVTSGQSAVLIDLAPVTTSWSDQLLTFKIPTFTSVPDQQATITVTTASGQAAAPLTVDFVATRDAQVFDVKDHGNLIAINYACQHAATDDSCGAALPGDPKWPAGRTFIDAHWKLCCKSTDSTDVYSLRLLNGWTLPGLDRYAQVPGNLVPYGTGDVATGALFLGQEAKATCWFFGRNHGARFKGVSYGLSTLAGYTVQIGFSWHVDGHCSFVEFDGDIVLSGPEGVPYWQ